jgi:hypothetical protein
LARLQLIDEKLLRLRSFFLKKRFYKEAYALGKIVLASDDSGPRESGNTAAAETLPMRPGVWKSRSEPHLLAAGLEPIRFIAGMESGKRGEGRPSKEGNIYEVLHRGRVAVAKVLSGFELAEPEVWRKIIKAKDSLPDTQARHLPEIYDIIKTDQYTTIIVMELLETPSSHIKNVLRTKELREKDVVLNNEEFLAESLKSAFNVIDEYEVDPEDRARSEVYALFKSDKTSILRLVEAGLWKKELRPEGVSGRIQEFASHYIKMFNLDDTGLSAELANKIQERFLLHLETAPQPVPKYYSAKDIDSTIQTLESSFESSEGSEVNPSKETIDKLNEERSGAVYSESPESFMYSEKYMPETKGLFALLNSLKDLGIEWSDVHANNIMERPGTRDMVLIDVGFFS